MDQLISNILAAKNPTAVGLDTRLEYLPESLRAGVSTQQEAAEAILHFNEKLLTRVAGEIPCVKIQIACYEMLGTAGMQAFTETARFAEKLGLYVIADAKRNDIGSTAECYAKAFLGQKERGFPAHSLTINAYLGSDGVEPFLRELGPGQSLFALVKTSNPSSGELQDLLLQNGNTVFEEMGDKVALWGKPYIGKYGYSALGSVVGATYPAQGEALRKRLPSVFFLLPGYGAQGAAAADLTGCFDGRGLGGVVNASRSVLCAWQKPARAHMDCFEAALDEVLAMKKALQNALAAAGKAL